MSKKDKSAVKDMAKVLAFERKINPSDAMMWATGWRKDIEEAVSMPIKVVEKHIRGTISNRLESTVASDPLKLKEKIEHANLQTADSASLPPHFDTLLLQYTLKFLPGFENPCACDSEVQRKIIADQCQKYIEKTGCKELAKRYALNIANGRVLWRNRVGVENCITFVHIQGKSERIAFNTLDYSLLDMEKTDEKIDELASYIADTLSGKRRSLLLSIEIYAQMGMGQEVYPSQELIFNLDEVNKNSNKKKFLYSIEGQAAIHSQKIGNALRTIDTWYPGYGPGMAPISIESYGSVTSQAIAYRGTENSDFYSLFDRWSKGEELSSDEEHYVVAMLIRGGIFGKGGNKE